LKSASLLGAFDVTYLKVTIEFENKNAEYLPYCKISRIKLISSMKLSYSTFMGRMFI